MSLVQADPLSLDGVPYTAEVSDPELIGEKMDWEGVIRIPHQDIMLVKNAMPFLPDIPQAAVDAEWAPSAVLAREGGESEVSADRTSRMIVLNNQPTESPLRRYARLLGAFEGQFVQWYFYNVNIHAKVEHTVGWELLRYGVGQEFREHVDTARYQAEWADRAMSDEHSIITQRRLSVIAFCNDDFEGGLLVFPRQRLVLNPGRGDVPSEFDGFDVVKAEPGDMVMWPSGVAFPHRCTPIESGERYVAVTWFF